MRTPQTLLYARCKKVPELARLVDDIDSLTEQDIESADVKESDRKLIRKALPEIKRQVVAADYAKSMPKNDIEDYQYSVYVYFGEETDYNGFEIPHGTVITYKDDWVRFDHYRIKKTKDIEYLLQRSEQKQKMNISELNKYIQECINKRHGFNPEQTTKERFSITSSNIFGF